MDSNKPLVVGGVAGALALWLYARRSGRRGRLDPEDPPKLVPGPEALRVSLGWPGTEEK